ncbi:MAG: cold-shock protein [Sedimentisphaeraceae bacterium JB056]
MSTGEVIWFDKTKGYGFIAVEGSQDVFVHHSTISSDVAKSLKTGVKVSFDVKKGEKGLTASEVSVIVS